MSILSGSWKNFGMKINRKIYWDTTCWLAWLNDERNWPQDVILGIQEVVYEVEGATTLLFTSAVTRGEIFMGRLNLDQKHSFSQIREYHSARGQSVHTPDATHLATAVLYRADEFHTMDGLRPGKSKRGLLKLNGDVGGYQLRVVNPYPRLAAPPKQLLIEEGPIIKQIEEHAKQEKENAKSAQDSTRLQADGDGRTGEKARTTEKSPKEQA